MFNERALQILLDTYWGKSGWRPTPNVTAENFAFAKQGGYMFDKVALTHDEIVEWLLDVRTRIDQKTVSDAFVASLTSRRRDLRSALGSYALASRFPAHRLVDSPSETFPSGIVQCHICGVLEWPEPRDLNILNFERCKWGGVRHFNPLYAAFDLTQFEKADRLSPTPADFAILAQIIDAAESMPADASATHLLAKLKIPGQPSRNERSTSLQLLSYCDIIATDAHPGYSRSFVPEIAREHPDDHDNDWLYPLSWWRGSDGVNQEALAYHFPDLAAVRSHL